MVPMTDLVALHHPLRDELHRALDRLLDHGEFVLGPEVERFEAEFARWLGAGTRASGCYAVGVNSGTDALGLALKALDVQGGEVITSPFGFAATLEAIVQAGATPVLADVDPETFTLDPADTARRLTPRTRALLPVHLFGCPADMDALSDLAERHGLAVVEDCSQSAGAEFRGRRVGTLGTVGCFSFFPSKNLGACGDAGMAVTADADLAARIRRLSRHGIGDQGQHVEMGWNSRLDSLQAAVLSLKLPLLDAWNARRREIAELYAGELVGEDVWIPHEPGGRLHVYQRYPIRHPERDRLFEYLQARGVGCTAFYRRPFHEHQAFRYLGYEPGTLPQAEAVAGDYLCLPVHPSMTDDQARSVVDAVLAFLRGA